MKNDFKLWWEVRGAELYAGLCSQYSAHGAAKVLAEFAWNEILGQWEASIPAPPIPGVVLEENPPPIPWLPLPGDGKKPGAVLCGACQNCGLENFTPSEQAVVTCAGCKYAGVLAGVFERPGNP